MPNRIVWEPRTGAYQKGCNGYLGDHVVFSLLREQRRRSVGTVIKLSCGLPGAPRSFGDFVDEAAARDRAEAELSLWLAKTGLEVING